MNTHIPAESWPAAKEKGGRIVETVQETLPEHYVAIHLKPLDDRMSDELIANMLNVRGVHHALIRQIIQRAGGNPYFIEEVVRSLIDEGAIVFRRGINADEYLEKARVLFEEMDFQWDLNQLDRVGRHKDSVT